MNNQPNIILIITDQQRYETIGALGYPHVDTPHLDRLVNEGVTTIMFPPYPTTSQTYDPSP